MKLLLLFCMLLTGWAARAQLDLTNPFSAVKKEAVNPFARATVATPATLNTFKANVSLPGYYYSSGKQQSAVVGFGYCFEHYVNDSLIYSVGPYIWYNSAIPTGQTNLPIGYGAAAGYKGLFLVGFMTPDFVHWGLVTSLDFSFGNGGIQFGGFNL